MKKPPLKSVYKDVNVELKISKYPPMWYMWVRPAVNLIPVTESGKIIIMREYKAGAKRWVRGFPGGIVEKGETPAHAAKRECEEELGLRVGKIHKVTEIKTAFPDTSVMYFLGYNLTKTKKKNWEWEKIGAVEEVTMNQLSKLAQKGKISDPRTVAALLRLQDKIKQGNITLKKS